jgi:SAM-dependent methyltransferase
MSFLTIYYPESRFGGFTDIDGTLTFYNRVHSLVTPASVVLDVGCGRGEYAEDPVAIRKERRIFRNKCAQVIGIDVDEAGKTNPFLDEFRVIEGNRWPVGDETINICLGDWVLEHIAEPESFFAECWRVLKPGGYLCLRTANSRSYVALVSRLVPNSLHAKVLNKVQERRKNEDVFPTAYRCNTSRKIRRTLDRYGFDNCVYEYESEPYYLSFSRPFYFLGVLHQRFAFRFLRAGIFVFAQKR